MIRYFVKPAVWRSATNSGMHALLGLVCFFVVLGSLLIPSNSYAFRKGDKVMVQNNIGLNVRENAGLNFDMIATVPNDAMGTIESGPVAANGVDWYQIDWEIPGHPTKWSAASWDGCQYLITPEWAEKKDEIVAQLFKLEPSKTNHDYNDHGCKLSWANEVGGYIDGHSGWDVQTQNVVGFSPEVIDMPFYSLTDGTVIRVGIYEDPPDSFNTIAVYSEDSNGNGTTTLYLHARNTFVYFGQKVKVGSCLGIQGNAGLWPPRDPADKITYADNPDSYSEHVHIEVREGYNSGTARGAFESKDPIDHLHGWVIAAEPIPPVKADVNEDGMVDVTDAKLVIKHLRESPGQFAPEFDVNGDGVIDIWDALAIVDFVYNSLCELNRNAAPASSVHNLNGSVTIGAGQVATGNVGVSHETVQQWLDLVREIDDGSLVVKHYITMLKSLLAVVVPEKTVLLANYPNPFNPETWIPYYLAKDTGVSVAIYDVTGALIRQLDIGHRKAGDYTSRNLAAYWDGRCETGEHVVSGVYFYTLTTEDYTATRKMVILK